MGSFTTLNSWEILSKQFVTIIHSVKQGPNPNKEAEGILKLYTTTNFYRLASCITNQSQDQNFEYEYDTAPKTGPYGLNQKNICFVDERVFNNLKNELRENPNDSKKIDDILSQHFKNLSKNPMGNST